MEPKTVTGAAKSMLGFCREVNELKAKLPDLREIETSIITFERGAQAGTASEVAGPSPNEFVVAAREMGLDVDIIPERARFDLSVVSALRNVVERRKPDIILTHHVKSHLIIRLSGVWHSYPWVAFHHGYTKTQARERLYNRMDRLSLPKADRVVTVCEAFARELTSRAGVPRGRIHVQHNSIRPERARDPEQAQSVRKQFEIAPDEKVVLSIGRLSSEKAHLDLVLAFNLLREINPNFRSKLIIVGDGPERGRLDETVRSFGLADSVRFAGQIRNVLPLYDAADVFALPSHSEGSPFVLLEAMAAKVPIVATAVGGVPEMVTDEESALLSPPGNPHALAAAIARVLGDSQLAKRLTANAYALVTSTFAPETQVRSLIELYRSILKDGR